MEERLNALAEAIISQLIFEEEYDNILADVREGSAYEIADELKHLIAKDFVRPCRDIENDKRSGILFDSDNLHAYSFALTAKGLSYLETYNSVLKSNRD